VLVATSGAAALDLLAHVVPDLILMDAVMPLMDGFQTTRLIKANPEKYELISERKVSDQETWGHLGLSGDTIFIRDLNGLNAWEWSHGKPAAPPSE
jgi:response regulator RpfG family c-di-GMP phosphodiesterase